MVLGFQFIFKFKIELGVEGAELNNGSVIMDWKTICTCKPKCNLQNRKEKEK